MCLAIPAQVIEKRDGEMALVEIGGVGKEVSLCLVDDVQVGDYIILHQGYALKKLDVEEAHKTLEVFAELRRKQQSGEIR